MLRKSWPLIMAAALILTGCASGPQTLTFKVTGIDNRSNPIKIQTDTTKTNIGVSFDCDTNVTKRCADITKDATVTVTVVNGAIVNVVKVKLPKKS